MTDDDILQILEIDLEIAEIGEILTSHGVHPSAALVCAIWDWVEELRNIRSGRQ